MPKRACRSAHSRLPKADIQRLSAHPARGLPIASDKFTSPRAYDERRSTATPRRSRQNCRYYVLRRRRIDSREQVERVRRASQQPTLISTTTIHPVYLALRQPAACTAPTRLQLLGAQPQRRSRRESSLTRDSLRRTTTARRYTHTLPVLAHVGNSRVRERTYCARDRIQGLHCRAIEIVTAA
jgi:hypothetical protein